MKQLIAFALASAALVTSGGAHAAVFGSLGSDGGAFLSLSNAGLNGGSVATLSGGTIYTSDQPFADIPFGAVHESRFLAAGPSSGTTATLTFAPGVNLLSFLWGSPDTYNRLTITTALGDVTNFTAAGLAFAVTNGNQGFSQYVKFSTSPGDYIASASFTNSPTINAFEMANFRVLQAVPEPATWAMMLIGFGAIGAAMRSAQRKAVLPATA